MSLTSGERADEQIRERFVYSYRLIYRITDRHVLVLAVVPAPARRAAG